MVEAKAWLYTLDGTTCQHVYLERQTHAQGWTETPLYGPEALAERDALIAELRELLKDVGDVLEVAARPARLDPDKYFLAGVKALGDMGGYGALMSSASALWREKLGDMAGGEFSAGPCVSVAQGLVSRIAAALKENNDDAC